ncbi:hypothetical protein CEXT_497831 [Caerostris extrusa]|uniref:Uncharacterized protein n=1 Tax=Caerostris extrusa TaxID=172846 RepID=A0AAV4TTA6_CAEEX|nr:hypothetical protein CEXT_497831 [Caerostris extrusa]
MNRYTVSNVFEEQTQLVSLASYIGKDDPFETFEGDRGRCQRSREYLKNDEEMGKPNSLRACSECGGTRRRRVQHGVISRANAEIALHASLFCYLGRALRKKHHLKQHVSIRSVMLIKPGYISQIIQ